MATCTLCHHHCALEEGKTGFCRVRTLKDGKNVCGNYGFATSIALDPIEKKPLHRFFPGSTILSFGSYGCNLRCPFCQNFQISQYGRSDFKENYVSPESLVQKAEELKKLGNIGVAFTYNEPLLSLEYIIDTAKLLHEKGMKTACVTNGNFSEDVARALKGHVDAYNIDLKGFSQSYYDKLAGNLEMVKGFIRTAASYAHVELTCLVVPGENDTEREIDAMAEWIASLSPEIPLHVSRFFPRWNMVDRDATPVWKVHVLAHAAARRLKYVYTGNC